MGKYTRKNWTDDEIATLKLMARMGASSRQISDTVGHSVSSVETKRHDLGVSGPQLRAESTKEPEKKPAPAPKKKPAPEITTAELLKYCNDLDDSRNTMEHHLVASDKTLQELCAEIRELRDCIFDLELYLQQTALRRIKPFKKEV